MVDSSLGNVRSGAVAALEDERAAPGERAGAASARAAEGTVAILFSERADPERYVISKLAEHWRADGLRVHYLLGTRRFVPADVLILHVDLSVLPEAVTRFAERYPRVVNRHVRDIRKRTFSTLLVERREDYAGPVIVKSNYNFGGGPESGGHPSPLARLYHRGRRLYFRLVTGDWAYRIYPSSAAVPAPIWHDPHFVVERFLPERRGADYAVRTYHCFGERESFFLLTSPRPIVKSGPETRIWPLEPDARLSALRRQLRLEYGKLDYVLVDGEPVVLDVNKTIGLTDYLTHEPCLEQARRERARAIYEFLERPPA